MSVMTATTTREFLTTIFGDNEGYVFISSNDDDGKLTRHQAFKYPEMLGPIEAYSAMREDEDLYFPPFIYSVPQRKQSAVSATPVVYADTDAFDPANYLVAPSIDVQTSEGRHHSYWLLDGEYEPEEVRRVARAIALTHADEGVDPSGWDLAQLLRLPNSINSKYGEPQQVEVVTNTGQIYSLEEIDAAYPAKGIPAPTPRNDGEMPTDLPQPVDVLRKVTASPKLADLSSTKPRGNQDWSDTLYRLVCEMFRAGFTAEEVLVGAWHAECNKYRRDKRPMEDLWRYDVLKAQGDPRNAPMSHSERLAMDIVPDRPKDEGLSKELELVLLTDEERGMLTSTFVDEYVAWAVTKTDAPAPYHVASALTTLSLIFGEWAVAFPQFGELRLGLFFVIMGETTDTRKTTARNMMKRLIRATEDPEFNYILTSDTTSESLLDNLAERPHLSSLYDRDEAQQLVADIKGGKQYMRGFFETLNELYDGWAHGRMRKDKTTKDTPVNFVQYLMGIRSQLQENLELSDFISGWGPRNIFVRGEAPPRTREDSRLKQGIPGEGRKHDGELAELGMKLVSLRNFWRNVDGDASREEPFLMLFEEDAWIRQTDLEWDLKEYFKDHPRFDTLKPSLDRLAINVMKVAVLLAMYERHEKVTMVDVLNARYYAMQWVEDLVIMVEGVNETIYRRDLDRLEKFIIENDGFVTVAKALRWATDQGHRKKDFWELVEVLEETDVIRMTEDGVSKRSIELKL